mmetsp:Transcript_1845/g.4888  ORF Transcript_1845/g.4888 Transcript_1845/m.4888 type:complete len:188 (-) Transcript_1845:187-750(-)
MYSSHFLLFLSPRPIATRVACQKIPNTRMHGSLPSLLDADGTTISSDAVEDRLRGKRAALYFAAGWCPMCTSFEPALLKFRQAAVESKKPVEMIYVGSDRSAKDIAERASALGMMSVSFDDTADMKRKHKVWAGPESLKLGLGRRSGVPALVVLGSSGEEIAFVAAEAEGIGALASWPLDDQRGTWN